MNKLLKPNLHSLKYHFFSLFVVQWSVVPTLIESHLYGDLDFITQQYFFLIFRFSFTNFMHVIIFLGCYYFFRFLTFSYLLIVFLSSLSFLTVELKNNFYLIYLLSHHCLVSTLTVSPNYSEPTVSQNQYKQCFNHLPCPFPNLFHVFLLLQICV